MKDTSIIPPGAYCYTWIETPSQNNNYRGKVKSCPYMESKNINGVHVPWCNYLELGGIPATDGWTGWDDYDKAINILNVHFGSEEEMDKILCLSLLFDECKECGINEGDDLEH